jgi:hypothetical protein
MELFLHHVQLHRKQNEDSSSRIQFMSTKRYKLSFVVCVLQFGKRLCWIITLTWRCEQRRTNFIEIRIMPIDPCSKWSIWKLSCSYLQFKANKKVKLWGKCHFNIEIIKKSVSYESQKLLKMPPKILKNSISFVCQENYESSNKSILTSSRASQTK